MSEVLDIPEIEVGNTERPGPNRCSIVLLRDCSDLEKLTNWQTSNWIIIWAEPRDIGGIIELNYRLKALAKEHKPDGVIIDRVIVDFQTAGFPPMYPQEYNKELRRLADKYVEFAKTSYADVKSFYFI